MRKFRFRSVKIWWSPCPSRECPEKKTVDLVLDGCVKFCTFLEVNAETTSAPEQISSTPDDLRNEDDLNFQTTTATSNAQDDYGDDIYEHDNDTIPLRYALVDLMTCNSSFKTESNCVCIFSDGNSTKPPEKEYDYPTYFRIDMHPDLGEPVEQLGMEMEQVTRTT